MAFKTYCALFLAILFLLCSKDVNIFSKSSSEVSSKFPKEMLLYFS
jgi:hypothetical protein